MRLRKGQKNYRLPKDFAMLENAFLKKGDLHFSLCHIDSRAALQMPALFGMPSYINIKADSRRQITFYPSPDKAYYCEFNYFARKAI